MADHIFIEKRKRSRRRYALSFSVKVVLSLISISLLVWMAFTQFIGNPNDVECTGACEPSISIGTWILAIALMFAAVIGAGAFLGMLVSVVRRRTAKQYDSPFANIIEKAAEENSDDEA
ncbi:hypothetical protein [Kordiimonas sp. SCSIO 12610]|uniref:hypothetical protein n=1 Tax=Kordiimonas sp. SCSIO 12610 TaxID=2829597 RepID=UPI00210DB15A|nr:hypothetical protein [Kordiimonas sp. SCSIO 12610]UTW55115.1 hypothetical protein KFF44_15125 [Kordiimonas sp. SCSIO 12610]